MCGGRDTLGPWGGSTPCLSQHPTQPPVGEARLLRATQQKRASEEGAGRGRSLGHRPIRARRPACWLAGGDTMVDTANVFVTPVLSSPLTSPLFAKTPSEGCRVAPGGPFPRESFGRRQPWSSVT